MIVADASPIIALTRIGRIDLIRDLFDSLIIPPAVETEIQRHPRGFDGDRPEWLSVRDTNGSALVASLERRLDRGEAEAITLALHLSSPLLVDEKAGRRIATELGISIIGTLGLLLAAKQAHLIPRLDSELEKLENEGFHIGRRLASDLRRAAGE